MYITVGKIIPASDKIIPGKRTVSVYLGGCNFKCPYCYDYAILEKEKCSTLNINDLLGLIVKDGGKFDAIEFEGAEPTLQKRPLESLCRFFKSQGILVKVHTNGTEPGVVGDLLNEGIVDYLALDIKAPFNEFNLWKKISGGFANEMIVQKIKESLDICKNIEGVDFFFEIVVPVIPGLNDKKEYIRKIAKDVQWCNSFLLQGFDNRFGCVDPNYIKIESPQREKLLELAKTARDNLINVDTVRIRLRGALEEL